MVRVATNAGRQLRLKLERDASLRREDFVVSASNRTAVEALDAWPGPLGGALCLVGPEGAGKTHLAGVWAERVGAVRLDGATAALADMPELEGRPVLLDDADEADDETLFHLLNLANAPGGSLLLTSRTPPAAWTSALPDLRSRLDALRVVLVAEPDDAVLGGVLRRMFEARAIRPSPDLVEYLVRRIERSVPAARDVVARLDDMAEHRPITRALARELFEHDEQAPDLFG